MFGRHWQWLIVALCSCVGIACSHSHCEKCSEASAGKPAHTCQSCSKSSSVPVVAVKQCPCGSGKTFVTVPKAECTTCEKSPEKSSAADTPSNTAVAPETPRVLDPKVAETKPIELPEPPPGVAKVADPHKEHRDPDTGMIRFDHAGDYAWIVGQLQYLHGKRQWRVRYAPADVDDNFGGVVIITGIDHMADKFKDGATVRVQGQLIDSDGRKAAPEYHVYDIKVLQ